jgi:hypothetical protein
VNGKDDNSGGESCADVKRNDEEYARQHKASATVYANDGTQEGRIWALSYMISELTRPHSIAEVVSNGGIGAMTVLSPGAVLSVQCATGGDGCTKTNAALVFLPEIAALREGGVIVREMAPVGKKGAEIIQKAGGAAEAAKEYGALNGAEKVYGEVRVKTLSDGTSVTLRGSSSGAPTVSIQHPNTQVTKIRY